MSRSTKIKSEILGIKFGTASNKLRKELMFNLVCQLNKNICYRCNKEIKTADEFSIDHKIPWQNHNEPVKMFFDLGNIAFSHLSCNCADAKSYNKIDPPLNKSWCHVCKNFLNTKEFSKRSTRWNNLDYECKSCKNKRYFKNK